MMYKAILQPRAIKELLEAWMWYEEKQVGLGERFENEVYKSLKEVEQHPKRYPEKIKFFRAKKIKTFPYLVIYRIEEKEKLIFASSIFHTSRNPELYP